ncbi:MAG TPA: hypothetical protein VLK84_20150 [Longimicrobium sp.]|nr:hypothetical protein [Longimicrobium sp.]
MANVAGAGFTCPGKAVHPPEFQRGEPGAGRNPADRNSDGLRRIDQRRIRRIDHGPGSADRGERIPADRARAESAESNASGEILRIRRRRRGSSTGGVRRAPDRVPSRRLKPRLAGHEVRLRGLHAGNLRDGRHPCDRQNHRTPFRG